MVKKRYPRGRFASIFLQEKLSFRHKLFLVQKLNFISVQGLFLADLAAPRIKEIFTNEHFSFHDQLMYMHNKQYISFQLKQNMKHRLFNLIIKLIFLHFVYVTNA